MPENGAKHEFRTGFEQDFDRGCTLPDACTREREKPSQAAAVAQESTKAFARGLKLTVNC